ncbi:hypothetical protein OG21DRAFT_1476703 [Imleria badia]|nr:hypothetical protein OG21DRAFT_1476703 [Imleria badia]
MGVLDRDIRIGGVERPKVKKELGEPVPQAGRSRRRACLDVLGERRRLRMLRVASAKRETRRRCYRRCRRELGGLDRDVEAFVGRVDRKIITFPNKPRVVTKSPPGHFSSLGSYIDTLGANDLLASMAFKSTYSHSEANMAVVIALLGVRIMCTSDRECMAYQSRYELDIQKDDIRHTIKERRNTSNMVLSDMLHHKTYGGEGLGNPLLCPQLVELVDKHFSTLKPLPSPAPPSPQSPTPQSPTPQSPILQASPPHFLPSSSPSIDNSLTRTASSSLYPTSTGDAPPRLDPHSHCVGGITHISFNTTEFDHLFLGFEGVGFNEDIYTLAAMKVLLGSGYEFSSGGLGRLRQTNYCGYYHSIYTDSSLFGMWAAFKPDFTHAQVLPYLVHQISLLVHESVPEAELQREKSTPIHLTPESVRRVANRLFGPDSGNKATKLGDWQETFRKYGVAGA